MIRTTKVSNASFLTNQPLTRRALALVFFLAVGTWLATAPGFGAEDVKKVPKDNPPKSSPSSQAPTSSPANPSPQRPSGGNLGGSGSSSNGGSSISPSTTTFHSSTLDELRSVRDNSKRAEGEAKQQPEKAKKDSGEKTDTPNSH